MRVYIYIYIYIYILYIIDIYTYIYIYIYIYILHNGSLLAKFETFILRDVSHERRHENLIRFMIKIILRLLLFDISMRLPSKLYLNFLAK